MLVYLGFLDANEMRDQGDPFATAADWEAAVRSHAKGIIPDAAWEWRLDVRGTSVIPTIRAMELPLVTS